MEYEKILNGANIYFTWLEGEQAGNRYARCGLLSRENHYCPVKYFYA